MSQAPDTWVHLPSLAVELPVGWRVSESSVVTAPSGVAVNVRLDRALDGWDAVALADHHEAAARAELGELEVISSDAVRSRSGGAAESRQFRFDRSGTATVGRMVCSVVDGLALTISATWPDGDVDAVDEMDRVAAAVRLMHRPVAAFGGSPDEAPAEEGPADGGSVVSPPPRPPVAASEWTAAREAWVARAPAPADLTDVTRWSAEEVAVFAMILGAPSFPTVGSEALAALPERSLTPMLAAVTSSLVARGVVQALEGGSVALSSDVDDVMQIAVFPDLTVAVDRVTRDGIGSCWFGVRPDRAAQVSADPIGSRTCARFDPGQLVGQILTVTGTNDRGGASTALSNPVVTLDDLLAEGSAVEAIARVTTAWRIDSVIHGGQIVWAIGADGALWLADPSTDVADADADADQPVSWTLRPCDLAALRSELVDHLPGS